MADQDKVVRKAVADLANEVERLAKVVQQLVHDGKPGTFASNDLMKVEVTARNIAQVVGRLT